MAHVETTKKLANFARRWSPRQRAALVVIIAYLTAAAFRLVLSAYRTGPLVIADEIGYLAHARVLAGGVPIDLSTATYYYSGSSLFMTPAFWVADHPGAVYQVVLVLQAFVSAAVLPLLYLLCRELGASRLVALGAAAAASFSVDATFWSSYALSESLLSTLTAAWVWLTVRVVRLGRSGAGMISAGLLGLTFGLLAASHSRGFVLVGIGVTVGILAIRQAGWRNALVCTAVGATSVSAALLLNAVTMAANYPGREMSGLIPTGGATDAGGLVSGAQIVASLGQVWYAAGATGLLAVYGVLHAWRLAGTAAPGARAPQVAAAGLLTLAGGAIAFGSAAVLVATSGFASPDYLVYGRYIASCLPIAIAIGLVGLAQRAGRVDWALRAVTVLAAIALSLVVRAHTGDFDPTVAARSFPIPGVTVIADLVAGGSHFLHELRVTAAAIVFFALCCALGAIGHRIAHVPLIITPTLVFAVLSAAAAASITAPADEGLYPDGAAALTVHAVVGAETIAWDEAIGETLVANITTRMRFAYFAGEARLEHFDSNAHAPPAGVDSVAASRSWNGAEAGFTAVTAVPGADIVIWTSPPEAEHGEGPTPLP